MDGPQAPAGRSRLRHHKDRPDYTIIVTQAWEVGRIYQNDHQLEETLQLACISHMGVAVVLNDMCGPTEAGKRLPDINCRFRALQTEHFGDQEIGQGIEIET